ncbi:MAG: hypothetical protein RLZZ528_1930 [Pseudomonadota bacterium]
MRVIAGVLAGLCAAGAAAAQEEVWFRSPTGNIHCAIIGGDWTTARCDLRQFSPSFPNPPPDCELDWGYGFEVAITGPAAPICAGDTVQMPGSTILDYGRSVTLGGITCSSARTGMTCVNREGHGFTVARAEQSVF